MELRYVAGVSWPRSGHHLMERLVQNYFGESFKYCSFYHTEPSACCQTFPCTRAGVSFTKNHDFGSSGAILPDVPYLVQYRAIAPASISDFELFLLDEQGEDTADSYRAYAMERVNEWAPFMAKWVDVDIPADRLLVSYESLVADPRQALRAAIPFFSPGTVPDEERIAHVIDTEHHVNVTKAGAEWRHNAGVKAFRDPKQFRFYDAGFFKELEAYAEEKRWQIAASAAKPVTNWQSPAMQLLRSSASKLKRLMS